MFNRNGASVVDWDGLDQQLVLQALHVHSAMLGTRNAYKEIRNDYSIEL